MCEVIKPPTIVAAGGFGVDIPELRPTQRWATIAGRQPGEMTNLPDPGAVLGAPAGALSKY